MRIEQAVQRFGAAREFDEIAFQRFSECVEKTPCIPWCECFVSRFAPFVQHARDEFVWTYPDVHGAHDQVVGTRDALMNYLHLLEREGKVTEVTSTTDSKPANDKPQDAPKNPAEKKAGEGGR